jgi:hypothetical protein
MQPNELLTVLNNHRLWLESVRADGKKANLRGANLHDANLCYVNLSDADLIWADLSHANLCGVNLSDADLFRASLRGADLTCANLSRANLRRTDLSGANLRGADLRGADLRCANLHNTIGNCVEVHSMQLPVYFITRTHTHMQIGCQRHKIDSWFTFNDNTIESMDLNALEWWRTYKPLISLWVQTCPAIPATGVQLDAT